MVGELERRGGEYFVSALAARCQSDGQLCNSIPRDCFFLSPTAEKRHGRLRPENSRTMGYVLHSQKMHQDSYLSVSIHAAPKFVLEIGKTAVLHSPVS